MRARASAGREEARHDPARVRPLFSVARADFSERGPEHTAQSRIHVSRAVPSIRGLQGHDGHH